MKNKFTLNTLFLLLLCSIGGNIKAQFMCTDLNPDSVVTLPSGPTAQHTLDIDLNNDNTPDFEITSVQSGTLGFIIAQTGASWANNFMLVDGSNNVLPLNAGDPITASSTVWHQMNSSNPSFVTIMGSSAIGTWAGLSDKYIGLALTVSTNTYYGWARLSFSGSANSYTLKEYGYNSVAGASITAGQACAPASTFAVSFSLQPTICQGDSAILTANTGTVAASGYTWSSNPAGVIFSAPNASTTSATFTSSTNYTISVAVTSGTMTGSSSHTIQVKPTPVIAVFSSSSTICAGSSAILTASSAATNYTWNTTATTQTISVSPTVTTTYTVVASLNGCTNSAVYTQSVTTCTGLTMLNELENGFVIFPNPANDQLKIRSNHNWNKTIQVEVMDILGRVYINERMAFNSYNQVETLNVSTLQTGIYFVKLTSENGNSRIVKITKD